MNMKMHRSAFPILFAFMVLVWGTRHGSASPEIPGAPQEKPIAILGATVHPVSGPAMEDATVVFDRGKIVAVGKDVLVPDQAVRVDGSGKHIYPGLFDAWTNLGLVEISSIRATVDDMELGQINPNVKSWVAVNPDSELIPVTRSNGVLLALSAPSGRLLAGRSAVLQLDGWTWEDMTLKADVGMHIHWPFMTPYSEWMMEDSPRAQMEQRDQGLELLKRAFTDARAYLKARRAPDSAQSEDARWEALIPVLEGKQPLLIVADELQQIQAAVAFADQQKTRLIIAGGYDAPLCIELLKKHQVSVIVGAVYRLPRRPDDDYDAPYSLPGKLHQAGVPFCISSVMRFGASRVRNLPYHAATAVAYGLPAEVALKSITLAPAQILGVADRVGSLEVGKDATLIITNGDPLETDTNVSTAYIQGRLVDLSDRHKRLWQKYEEKYRRLKEPQ